MHNCWARQQIQHAACWPAQHAASWPGQQVYSANMLAANKLLAQHSRQWKIPRQHEVYSQPNDNFAVGNQR